MRPNPSITPVEPPSKPSHDDIAQCARELWVESGKPTDRDDAIWFEAERRLISVRRAPAAVVKDSRARRMGSQR
jgi:hypothetical protein